MPELHTCLWSDIAAFDFNERDFDPLKRAWPDIRLVTHQDTDAFLAAAANADWVLTWDFEAGWYAHCPKLRAVFTPAAGDDWVAPDPAGRVKRIHGTFHGPILAESLLGALLFMNHAMPAMIRNFQSRSWDRNIQTECRLLANQTVLILGLGHIGTTCARAIAATGARIIGIKRDPSHLVAELPGVDVRGMDALDESIREADHIVLLLPGGPDTDRLLTARHLKHARAGVFIYNFGRGNALGSEDIIAAADHIGGAFLDVVDEEPLPQDSPLWTLPNIMITPHSSCVYREYKSSFINEVIEHGNTFFQ